MRKILLFAFLAMIWPSPRPVLAGDPPVTPASLTPCPFTPEEIGEALGLQVGTGEAADMKFPGGRDVGCVYQVVGGSTMVAVRQTWDPSGSSGSAQAAGSKRGRTKAIPGDPDGAQWKVSGGKENEPQVELSYARGKVQTRVLIHGRSFLVADMEPRLLKLKRVP